MSNARPPPAPPPALLIGEEYQNQHNQHNQLHHHQHSLISCYSQFPFLAGSIEHDMWQFRPNHQTEGLRFTTQATGNLFQRSIIQHQVV